MIKVQALANNRAEILIHEPIGENWYGDGLTSKRFVDDLKALGPVTDILVRINSPGGAVFDGIAIYNALRGHSARVEVLVEGLAASAASAIAMAGDVIRMGIGAQMMIHNPWTFAMGDAEDLRATAAMLEQVAEGLVEIYQAKTGLEKNEIRELLNAETWFTGPEAVAKGFATQVDSDDEESADASARAAAAYQSQRAVFQSVRSVFNTATRKVPLPQIPAVANKSAPAGAITTGQTPQERDDMTIKTDPGASASAGAEATAAQAAIAAEQNRRTEIRARFGKFSAEHRDLLDTCLDDVKCTPDAAAQKLLAALGSTAEPLAPRIEAGADVRDKFIAGATEAILVRSAVQKGGERNEFSGMSLTDLAAKALSIRGVSVRGMSRDQIARKVLASHTSSDFPNLLSNAAGKVLRQAYALAPVTWNRWCKVGSVSDFKAATRHTVGSFSSLTTKPEAGEYKSGTLSEEKESIQAITKGRYITLSREMLVNDDLAAFTGMSQKLGRAAARTVEADVYTLLTSASGAGPTMSDTGAFFNSTAVTTAGGHANLAGSGGAITVPNIAAGEAAMMVQKDKGLNDYLALQPRFLLCSPAKKQIAWEVVNSLTDVSQSNSAKRNYVQAQLNLEVLATPYLSGTPWYLFTDPADVEAFEVAFLDGVQEPFIDEEIEFMTDAMNMKVRLDYGVAAIDWRGGYRNPGA